MDVKEAEALATEAAEKVRSAVLKAAQEAAAKVETEQMPEAISVAVAAFADQLRTLLKDPPAELTLSAAATAGRRAALVAASEYVWPEHLGPLFPTTMVRDLLGGVTRQRVNELWSAHRLIGLADHSGRRQFPAFQFRAGRTLELLIAAFWIVHDAGVGEWTAASWCVSPDPALDNDSPAVWIREGRSAERLLRVAHQDAARLAQ